MKIREVMEPPIPVALATPVEAACALAEQYGADQLVVIDGSRVVGLASARALAAARDDDDLLLTVAAVMVPLHHTIGPDQSVFDAAQAFYDDRIGAIAVVEGEELVGVVSRGDLLRAHGLGRRIEATLLC